MAATVIALVNDLFFLAKIRETATALGVSVVVGTRQGGVDAIAKARPQAIYLDLNARGEDAMGWIGALKADPATCRVPIVGFASHVQKEVISAARAAGCDEVMARSAFAQRLPDLLRGLRDQDTAAEKPGS